MLLHRGADVALVSPFDMLRRHHDLRGAHRLAVFILKRDLALRVGKEFLRLAGATCVRHCLQDPVREIDRRRHELVRLATGIAEHDALVARAFILVAGGVNANGNVCGLGMDEALDSGLAPVEAFLVIADVLDRHAGGLDHLLMTDGVGAADFASQHDAVRRRQRFKRHAGFRHVLEEQIDDRVRYAVAHLVRVTFGNGFAREQVIFAG